MLKNCNVELFDSFSFGELFIFNTFVYFIINSLRNLTTFLWITLVALICTFFAMIAKLFESILFSSICYISCATSTFIQFMFLEFDCQITARGSLRIAQVEHFDLSVYDVVCVVA